MDNIIIIYVCVCVPANFSGKMENGMNLWFSFLSFSSMWFLRNGPKCSFCPLFKVTFTLLSTMMSSHPSTHRASNNPSVDTNTGWQWHSNERVSVQGAQWGTVSGAGGGLGGGGGGDDNAWPGVNYCVWMAV